jgi:hypothetical protein
MGIFGQTAIPHSVFIFGINHAYPPSAIVRPAQPKRAAGSEPVEPSRRSAGGSADGDGAVASCPQPVDRAGTSTAIGMGEAADQNRARSDVIDIRFGLWRLDARDQQHHG